MAAHERDGVIEMEKRLGMALHAVNVRVNASKAVAHSKRLRPADLLRSSKVPYDVAGPKPLAVAQRQLPHAGPKQQVGGKGPDRAATHYGYFHLGEFGAVGPARRLRVATLMSALSHAVTWMPRRNPADLQREDGVGAAAGVTQQEQVDHTEADQPDYLISPGAECRSNVGPGCGVGVRRRRCRQPMRAACPCAGAHEDHGGCH